MTDNPLDGLCADLTVEGSFPFEQKFAAWTADRARIAAADEAGETVPESARHAHADETLALLELAAPALIGLEILHSYIEGDDDPSAADTCQSLYALMGGLDLTVS